MDETRGVSLRRGDIPTWKLSWRLRFYVFLVGWWDDSWKRTWNFSKHANLTERSIIFQSHYCLVILVANSWNFGGCSSISNSSTLHWWTFSETSSCVMVLLLRPFKNQTFQNTYPVSLGKSDCHQSCHLNSNIVHLFWYNLYYLWEWYIFMYM